MLNPLRCDVKMSSKQQERFYIGVHDRTHQHILIPLYTARFDGYRMKRLANVEQQRV